MTGLTCFLFTFRRCVPLDEGLLDVWSSIQYNFYCRQCAFTEDNVYNGVRTLRHQDSSAPNNWCRSVRTLRHQFFTGAELSHGHFGLVPNCLGAEVS